jgi:hypothetical protein
LIDTLLSGIINFFMRGTFGLYIFTGGEYANQCGDTREGPMCGQCKAGRTEWSSQCVECDSVNGGYLVLFLFFTTVGAYFLHRASQVSTGQMKVFFFFVQTAVVIVGSSQTTLRWMDFFNFQPGNPFTLPLQINDLSGD